MDTIDDEGQGSAVEATLRSEPDIKLYIRYLKKRLELLKEDLRANQNDSQLIRSEVGHLEGRSSESSNDIMNSTLDSLEKLNQAFHLLQHESKAEDNFLKQQLTALGQEKTKLEQSVLMLGTRVAESETQVGVQLRLPEVEDR